MKVRITGRYGEVDELHPKGHTGVDLGLQEGTPLHSLYDGVIERVVDYGRENIGKGIIIRFEDGTEGIYGHLSDIKVSVGQKISEGEIIGYSGNTGFSTGPHLHLGLKENGHFVDPTPLAEKLGKFIERGSVSENDYPTVWGWIYEKTIGEGLSHWITDFISVFPLLAVISVGVFALINMFSRSLAKLGVIGVFLLGALECL